jgi:hypothetical protein
MNELIDEWDSLVNRQTVEIDFIGQCFHMAAVGPGIMTLARR